jgi:polyisoprenoid-binding protein YceI
MFRTKNLSAVILAVAIAAGAPALASSYDIDTAHSTVLFKIRHLGVADFYGRFNGVSGTFTFDPAEPTKGSIDISVKADSVDTDNEKRDQHLMSPDFFNAKQFPVITFKSESVKKVGDKKFEVTGTLNLHGVSKKVTAAVDYIGAGDDPWGGYRAGFEARVSIKRSDFGITFMPGGLGENVDLIVALEGKRK